MAKNSLFWGKASGKLGEVVLYRSGGEQRSRTYVSKIKNPKSALQMAQRVKMASLVGFFKSARQYLRSSFSNRPANQSGFNAFVSSTLRQANTAVSLDSADMGYSVPLYYAISRGTVAYPQMSNVLNNGSSERRVCGLLFATNVADSDISEVAISDLDELAPFIKEMAARFSPLAELPSKFNINIICSVYDDEGFSTETRTFVVEKAGQRWLMSGNAAPFKYDVYPFGIVKSTNSNGETLAYLALGWGDATSGAGNGSWFVGAFISYTDENGKLVTSNGFMNLVWDGSNYVEQFQPGGRAYEDYLNRLGVGTTDILATR
jgi:hypothetical protein